MSACPSCSAEAERRQFLSLQLSQLVEEDASSISNTRLESIANGVTQKLDHLSFDSGATVSQTSDSQSPDRKSSGGGTIGTAKFGQLLLGLAAGFLLALAIFQPWNRNDEDTSVAGNRPDVTPTRSLPTDFGVLRVAVKPLQVQLMGQDEWTSVLPNSPVPMKCRLQTDGTLCCEIEQPNGRLVRIDRDSELTIGDREQFKLESGQVWVEAQQSNPVEIEAADLKITATGPCNAEAIDGTVELVSFDEPILVCGKTWEHLLAANSTATFDDQGVLSNSVPDIAQRNELDLILASAWIHEFLMQSDSKTQFDSRLRSLCNGLNGESSSRCASELRKLGPAAAEAIAAWLASDANQEAARKSRRLASELLADTASYVQAGQLIALLDDEDPIVSQNLERGLERITGHRIQPLHLKARAPTQRRWLEWWQEESTTKPQKQSLPSTRKLKA